MQPAAVGITEDAARRQREEAVFNPANCLKSYIKEMHGNKQALFNKESVRIVYEAAKALKESVQSQEDVPTIWRNLLEKLAKERGALAVKQGALYADQFGQWMDQDGEDTFFCTNLADSHYQEYGNQILGNIQARLKTTIKEQGSDTRKGLCRGWGDDKSRFYVRVFHRDEIEKMMNIKADQRISHEESLQQVHKGYQGIVTTGEVQVPFPDLTKGIYQISEAYPSAAVLGRSLFLGESNNKKSAYILLVNVLKIDGVWRAMTGYLTWVHEDEPFQLTEKVIDRMSEDCLLYHGNQVIPRKKSQIMILHSCTKEQREAVFRDTANIVKEVVHWDGNKEKLRNQLSEIAYKLIALNPTFRGWAAIVKWADCTLWKFQDLELIPYNPNKQMDLEIHATPFMPNFIKKNAANFHEQKGP